MENHQKAEAFKAKWTAAPKNIAALHIHNRTMHVCLYMDVGGLMFRIKLIVAPRGGISEKITILDPDRPAKLQVDHVYLKGKLVDVPAIRQKYSLLHRVDGCIAHLNDLAERFLANPYTARKELSALRPRKSNS